MSMVYLLEVTKTISKKAKSDLPDRLYQALLKLEVTPQQLFPTSGADSNSDSNDTPVVVEDTSDVPVITPITDNVTCHLVKPHITPETTEDNLTEGDLPETETTPLPDFISDSDPETDLDSLPHYVSVVVVKSHHYPRYSKADATSFKFGLVTFYLLTNHQLEVPKFIIPDDDDTFTYRRGIRKWLHAEWKVKKSHIANIKHLETKRNHHVYVCTLEKHSNLLNLPFAYHVPQNSNQHIWKDINLSIPIQQVDNPTPETYHRDDIHYPDVQFRVTTKYNIHLKDIIKTYGDTLVPKT